MNPHVELYQFTHDGDGIGVARISEVQIKRSTRDGQERVSLDLRIEESLWDGHNQSAYSYFFDRPAYEMARLKFPDPVWGRVDLRSGAEVLLVTPSAPPSLGGTQNPVYVEGIPAADDPVLRSIREVLVSERAKQSDADRFDRRLRWLASGDVVHKLFAGEILAKEGQAGDRMSRVILAFARAFSEEQDPYTKISLGTWLWQNIYPQTVSEDGRIAIVNATVGSASSESPDVRTFVIDRVSDVDPRLLGKPAVRPSREVIALLEDRRRNEPDASVRESLDRVINALRR
jgi:hypothetical protein